jgi:hypothetical protein
MTIRPYDFRRTDDGMYENWCSLCSSTASTYGSRLHECSGRETCGPGCQLRRTLAWFVRDDGKCGCTEYAAEMDRDGPDGCEARIDQIVAHLVEQAAKKSVLLGAVPSAAITVVVRRAIEAARAEAAATPPPV